MEHSVREQEMAAIPVKIFEEHYLMEEKLGNGAQGIVYKV